MPIIAQPFLGFDSRSDTGHCRKLNLGMMDSQDYQHACERAELLGLPKPSEEEWKQTQAVQSETRDDDDDGALQVIALHVKH